MQLQEHFPRTDIALQLSTRRSAFCQLFRAVRENEVVVYNQSGKKWTTARGIVRRMICFVSTLPLIFRPEDRSDPL